MKSYFFPAENFINIRWVKQISSYFLFDRLSKRLKKFFFSCIDSILGTRCDHPSGAFTLEL